MGKENDSPLLQYFRNRKAWLLEGDDPAPRLAPYPK